MASSREIGGTGIQDQLKRSGGQRFESNHRPQHFAYPRDPLFPIQFLLRHIGHFLTQNSSFSFKCHGLLSPLNDHCKFFFKQAWFGWRRQGQRQNLHLPGSWRNLDADGIAHRDRA